MFFADAERALSSIEFFKTRYPEYIIRSMRSLTFRASPDAREILLMRAIAIEVVRFLERAGIPVPPRKATPRPPADATADAPDTLDAPREP
jgi:tRNA C32,U32 (ribose-2'-O)-methylase TrmJ